MKYRIIFIIIILTLISCELKDIISVINAIQWHHLSFLFLIIVIPFILIPIRKLIERLKMASTKNMNFEFLPEKEKIEESKKISKNNLLDEKYIKAKLIQEFPYLKNDERLLNDKMLPACKGNLISQGIIMKTQFDNLLKEKKYIKILEDLYIEIVKRPRDKPFNALSVCVYLPALKNHKANFKLINAIQNNLYNSEEYKKLKKEDWIIYKKYKDSGIEWIGEIQKIINLRHFNV